MNATITDMQKNYKTPSKTLKGNDDSMDVHKNNITRNQWQMKERTKKQGTQGVKETIIIRKVKGSNPGKPVKSP